MELPEVTKALNAWQEMRNYNAGLLSEQSRLIAERDALKALNQELVKALQLVPALRPLLLKEMGYVPESVLNITNAARTILDKVRP